VSTQHFDLLVIGTGPAGEGAAMRGVKAGKSVAVVEQQSMVGGNCTHWGTIPSKALRHSVKQLIEFNTNPMFRDIGEPRLLSFPRVLANAEDVIKKQVAMRAHFYARNKVKVFFGTASFVDDHTLVVEHSHTTEERLTAANIIIATGSRPYRPADVDFNHPRIYCSDKILSMQHTPRSLIIFGAGVVGCEYASIFCGLGIKVDLIDTRDHLMPFLDDEISDALSYHLRDQGVLVRHNERYRTIKADDKHVVLTLESGKKIRADALLWANGRTGNTDQLALANAGLAANERGRLEVNEHYQTAVPHIYAVGDVIGWPGLASAAYDQGRFAVDGLVTDQCCELVTRVPTGIYTIPEISSIGKTEAELTAAKVPYEVGQAFFKSIARAQITNDKVGMLKLLFHRETLEILGIHCFGDQATEIVHIGQAIMDQQGPGNTINYFINTTFNYPTMAEAYRVAALNGLNRLF
jgi:NAD(P) transhydrogenase